ncbi:Uncharacterised protein [uncultured archaeon]|nr:Uncharacterised protein [uncultured archaeon]
MIENYQIGQVHIADSNQGFSVSQYLFGIAYLEGHKKIVEGNPFPKTNPTKEDFSRLVITLKEQGLKF